MSPDMSPQCELNRSDFADTLVFSEEVDVRQGFGEDLDTMNQSFGSKAIRALVYVHRRRAGDTVKEARSYAQGLTRGEMLAYFAPDEDVNADQGKDETPTGEQPNGSPAGA